jgi:hypothetical protein
MSHHFDTTHAKEDPRLNLCDVYLFAGEAGKTVMIMTMNADAGISSPDTLHPEGIYAFRFDLNSDAHEELVFKFRFGESRHADGYEFHVQDYQVRRAGPSQLLTDAGELLLEGSTGKPAISGDIRAFVSVVPELWAADAGAFFGMLTALHEEDRFDEKVFESKTNLFKNRNVMAIVLEVPTSLIGEGLVHCWGTISLYGHAPETQVSRWGYPLFTHLFLSDPTSQELAEKYHVTTPSQDVSLFAEPIAGFTAKLSSRAGAAGDPHKYGADIANRLCPSMLPYRLGSEASFTATTFNGRPLYQDAYDVMLTLAAGKPVADGVAPAPDRIKSEFPYYGKIFTKTEQKGLTPIQGDIGLKYGG